VEVLQDLQLEALEVPPHRYQWRVLRHSVAVAVAVATVVAIVVAVPIAVMVTVIVISFA
jgi:hypothetical protein